MIWRYSSGNAIKLVLLDDGFDLPTGRKCSVQFIEANKKDANDFANKILRCLRDCCSHPRLAIHTFKERMWEKYYN